MEHAYGFRYSPHCGRGLSSSTYGCDCLRYADRHRRTSLERPTGHCEGCKRVASARQGGFRIFFSRHLSLPNEAASVSQLRTAMAWQRKDKAEDVKPSFPRDSPQARIVPEVTPLESEVIFDKLGMSFFVGTPLEMVLRDCAISSLAIVGVVLEVGIEPTARHAADLGFLPVLIADACGSVSEGARKRSLDALAFGGNCIVTDSARICDLLVRGGQ
jgi:biuret amidohydrolase